MLTLYYAQGACSLAVHALLESIGEPFELKSISFEKGENRSPEFLKINPRGQVPVLIDDGQIIREGAAILTYLAEEYGSPLLPREGKERAQAMEWLSFANATLHPAYSKMFWFPRALEDGDVKESLSTATMNSINTLWEEVNERLSKQAFIAGEEMTLADILLTVIGGWGKTFKTKPVFGSNTERMFTAVRATDFFQRAVAAEQNAQAQAA